MLDQRSASTATFKNPVYPRSFPDPFVLKFEGDYYAYATGFAETGTVFPVLHSIDLVNWKDVGGAMMPLENSPPFYWAPEVTYDNGKFYLYYSVGNEALMELRVAVSDHPDRDFIDAGVRLTNEDFAIDAHVFVDDGVNYLFYATDFLEHSHIGTGTVVDRMIDWLTLEGDPKPVTRAKYDWQIYDPNRKEKGGVRWHTVEGPAVLKRKGKYYEMFSGGNWQNTSYGVSFASSDSLSRDDEWDQFSDGLSALPILRTIPEVVVGPGHNCVVRGPNNRELYCVYHRWTDAGRVMAIDRMDFAGDRIFVVGATHTAQPFPYLPRIQKRIDDIKLTEVPESFLIEIAGRFANASTASSSFRLDFETDNDRVTLSLDPSVGFAYTAQNEVTTSTLPHGFVTDASHVIRIEVDHRRLNIKLDGTSLVERLLDSPVKKLSVQGSQSSKFDLTEGFDELFENELPLEDNGWSVDGESNYAIKNGELELKSANGCLVRKGTALETLEFVANFRVVKESGSDGEFGIGLFSGDEKVFALSVDSDRLAISIQNQAVESHPLPQKTDLSHYHQLRIVKLDTQVLCYFDDVLVSDAAIDLPPTSAGVFVNGLSVAIEMIRLTSI